MNLAIKKISHKHLIISKSSFYENSPWQVDSNHEDYINMAVKISTNYSPEDLMIHMLNIERELGRKNKGEKKPRTIDIDILLYGNEIIKSKILNIPHRYMHLRPFVLIPMNEIDPNIFHPLKQKTIKELLNNLNLNC